VTWTTYVGAGALVAHDGRLLMVRQRRAYGTHWELPAGYVEANESLETAAAREVLEETSVAVDVGPLAATVIWEREADRRRNILAWFVGTTADVDPEPLPQVDEEIDAAAFVDPAELAAEIHPLEQAVIERWWPARSIGFHVRAEVSVHEDGTQSYTFHA
jgi:8-oxo-dGTP diphosphatase